MTHHLQSNFDFVDEVVVTSYKQRMGLLSHYKHNICRNAVWSLEVKYSKTVKRLTT